MGGLLGRVCYTVHIFQMSSNPLLALQSCSSQVSTLGEREWAFQSWGSWVLTHQLSFSLWAVITGLKRSLLAPSCAWLGEGWCKQNLNVPLTLTSFFSFIYLFPPTLCWNFSARNLDFCRSSLICGWLSMMLLARDFQTFQGLEGPESSKGHCRVHIQDRSLYALTHGGQDSSQVPWRMVLDPISPTKALLSTDGCQIVILGSIRIKDLLFSHFASVTQKPRNIILMEVPPQGNKDVGNTMSTIKTKSC